MTVAAYGLPRSGAGLTVSSLIHFTTTAGVEYAIPGTMTVASLAGGYIAVRASANDFGHAKTITFRLYRDGAVVAMTSWGATSDAANGDDFTVTFPVQTPGPHAYFVTWSLNQTTVSGDGLFSLWRKVYVPAAGARTASAFGLPDAAVATSRSIIPTTVTVSAYLGSIYGLLGTSKVIYPILNSSVTVHLGGTWTGASSIGLYSPDGSINTFTSPLTGPQDYVFAYVANMNTKGVQPYIYQQGSAVAYSPPGSYVQWTPVLGTVPPRGGVGAYGLPTGS